MTRNDPLADIDVAAIWGGLSPALKRSFLQVPGPNWLTAAELKPATGMALTLLVTKHDLLERRWTKWGGEFGQKTGEGYEYAMTDKGLAVLGYALDAKGAEGGCA